LIALRLFIPWLPRGVDMEYLDSVAVDPIKNLDASDAPLDGWCNGWAISQ
jgi:hypothetical protein